MKFSQPLSVKCCLFLLTQGQFRVSIQVNVHVFGHDLKKKKRCEMYLKVLQGELQHVSEDITKDLRLPLHQHILIVQRLDHLRFHLQKISETYWNI